MRSFKRSKNRGFTLVELMIVVAIIGVLAALAIYGVRRYLASAKTSEAKNSIGAISRGAIGAFERETTVQEIIAPGQPGETFSHDVCDDAPFVPDTLAEVGGRKYQSNPLDGTDFEQGGADFGWKCLKFNMSSPQYYSYGYTGTRRGGPSTGTGFAETAMLAEASPDMPTAVTDNGFRVFAIGDLDGDGTASGFTQQGTIEEASQALRLATEISITDEFE